MSNVRTGNEIRRRSHKGLRGQPAPRRPQKRRPLPRNIPSQTNTTRQAPAIAFEDHNINQPFVRVEPLDCSREMQWLTDHSAEYAGQWVALDGNRLLAHGEVAREVYMAARDIGISLPLIVRVDAPDQQLPFGGW